MAEPRNESAASASERVKRDPATSWVTWVLAFVFLVMIDACITRTAILWGPTAFENSGGLRTVFPQTYQVLRKIYHPARDAETRVALLGNSRLALSIEGQGVEREIAGFGGERDVAIDNLAIFGAYVGDTAILARHLPALDPDLVVLTLGPSELSRPVTNPLGTGPVSLLRIGWTDGPVPASGLTERVDRWARTVWPLYRFREFAREAILDDALGRPDPGPPPSHFETRLDLFRHLYGERGDAVMAAHEAFLADKTLENFVRFTESANPGHLHRQLERVKKKVTVTRDSEPAIALDQLMADLKRRHPKVLILLMPENPIFELDTESIYHHREQNEQAAIIALELAEKHGIPAVDGRRWLPADVFLDFHHPLFEPQHFERRLAKELLDALDS